MNDGAKLEASGNLNAALALYIRDRSWADAARIALSLGRNLEAGNYWLQAGRPYDAAVCFQKVGAHERCLDALLHVPFGSPRYRSACLHAVRVSGSLQVPLESHSAFLMPFISSKPLTEAEADVFNQIAGAFTSTGRIRLARSIYRSVLSAFPDDAPAKQGLADLPAEEQPEARSSSEPPPRPSAPRPTGRSIRGVRLGALLCSTGAVTPGELSRVIKAHPEVAATDSLLGEALVAEGLLTAADLVRTLAEHSGIPFLSDEELLASVCANAAQALPLEHAERWLVVPVGASDRQLTIAMRDPRDIGSIDRFRFATGVTQVVGVFATELGIRQAIRKAYYGEEIEEQWRGQVWTQGSGAQASAPFSDRHTRTRERQFDTQDLQRRLESEARQSEQEAAQAATVLRPATHRTLELHAQPEVGSTFAGRFRIEALLGEGGTATVFRAIDSELNEPIALKLFRPSTRARSEDLDARFKLELSLSRQLAHPNLIRLFDLGSYEGWRYLTMELLEGSDLATMLAGPGKAMPQVEGLGYLEQFCVGLQAAHERGVIHRDIKPQNLFITSDGVAKVMDFGIAKKLQGPSVTVAGTIVGTPEYMAPEQTTGFGTVTPAADLYALGATAYAMFTGKPPFTYPDLVAMLMAHAREIPLPPRLANPALDLELQAVILRLLEKDPAQRFASARALADAFRKIRLRLESARDQEPSLATAAFAG